MTRVYKQNEVPEHPTDPYCIISPDYKLITKYHKDGDVYGYYDYIDSKNDTAVEVLEKVIPYKFEFNDIHFYDNKAFVKIHFYTYFKEMKKTIESNDILNLLTYKDNLEN